MYIAAVASIDVRGIRISDLTSCLSQKRVSSSRNASFTQLFERLVMVIVMVDGDGDGDGDGNDDDGDHDDDGH